MGDGWFYTGDIGRVDEEGYFTIEERKKDMIKASGYSVFSEPELVEWCRAARLLT